MKTYKLILALAILAAMSFLPISYSLEAAINSSSIPYGASRDAIAIRVMSNSEHYSPLVWYKKNVKLKGSPQSLLVDGYEAVRDGRTVYVNAANIDGNKFYTNIYIISYNQDAENATIDIFGQLLSHWKFNINPEIGNEQKRKIIRDVKRLADLQDMKLALANYKQEDGFPHLKSGSYKAGMSTSVWPSWQATLGKALGASLPRDPIENGLKCQADCCKNNSCASADDQASCSYDEKTCWNETNKEFYFDLAGKPSISNFPVYWYKDGIFHVGLETTNNYEILSHVDNVSFGVTAPQ